MKNWHVLLPEKDRNLVAMRKEIVFKHQEINISTNISPKGEDFGKTCFIKTHGKKMCFHGFFLLERDMTQCAVSLEINFLSVNTLAGEEW